MAIKIPTIEQKRGQSEESGLATVPNIPDQSGVIAGQALQGFGADLQKAAVREKAREDTVNRSRGFRTYSFEVTNAFRNFGEQTDKSDPKSLSKWVAINEELKAKALANHGGSPESQAMFSTDLDNLALDYESKLLNTVRDTQIKVIETDITDQTKPLYVSLQNGGITLDAAFGQVTDTVNSFSAVLGTKQRLDLIDKINGDLTGEALTRLVNSGETDAAKDLINRNSTLMNSIGVPKLKTILQKISAVENDRNVRSLERQSELDEESNERQQRLKVLGAGNINELTPEGKAFVLSGKGLNAVLENPKSKIAMQQNRVKDTNGIKQLRYSVEKDTDTINELLIQMSSLDAEGVVDYRNAIESGDKNKAAIILNEAIRLNKKGDFGDGVGFGSDAMAMISGSSDSGLFESKIMQVKSMVTLSTLKRLKEETGAVGQTSDTEVKLYQAVKGVLDPSNPQDVLKTLLSLRADLGQTLREKESFYTDVYGEDKTADKTAGKPEDKTDGKTKGKEPIIINLNGEE